MADHRRQGGNHNPHSNNDNNTSRSIGGGGGLPHLSGIARRPDHDAKPEDRSGQLNRFERPAPLPLPPNPARQRNATNRSTPTSARKIISSSMATSNQSEASSAAAASMSTKTPTMVEEIDPDDTIPIRLLGHGSSGKVYKVQHKRTGKLYALKIIQEKQQAAVCKQILTEVDILRRANNPHIVQCYGAYEKAGEISFVLEYMDGGSLGGLLESKRKISERYLSEVAKQVLKGLDYLHRNRIVHRDIKPCNILLGRNREVKIADFGVSTVLANTLAACNTFVGTCAYMSPERFDPDSHGGNYNGYAADIWALGLSLLECALGRFPYLSPGQNGDWPTLMFAICYSSPPAPPPDASPEFQDFIVQCLQKDPAVRPRAYTLLTHRFITKFEDPIAPVVARPVVTNAPKKTRQPTGGHFWGSFSRAMGSIFS